MAEREKSFFWILGLFRAETALEPSEKFFNFSALFY